MVLVNTFFRQPTHFWLKPEIISFKSSFSVITKSSRYNTDKAKIMLRDDAAIQLALGESQIVKDIQTYLEDNGVKVQSKTILKITEFENPKLLLIRK